MKKKNIKKLIIILIVVILLLSGIWFGLLSPLFTFKKNETKMLDAAKRYYELNPSKLPTGKRVSTVTLKELFDENYLKDDFYVAHSKTPCSVTKSWVKVKQNDGKYSYYPYLECGILKSNIDHKGPEITLNGQEEITLDRGAKYEEPGVKNVKDNVDGVLDPKDVLIDNSKVDTSKIGSYTITYTATDSFKNTTVVKRKVNVIQKLKKTVEEDTDDSNLYKGESPNNHLVLSGIDFRIIGVDKDNIKITTSSDIANVNYDDIEKWLDYFYENLTAEAKDLIVENTYCNGTIVGADINTNNKCISKTGKKKAYILSNYEINNTLDKFGNSYTLLDTISWIANTTNDKEAWAAKKMFNIYTTNYVSSRHETYFKEYNFGVRPLLTIKGDTLIKEGDGTSKNPYKFNETKSGKANEKLNTRHAGEYVSYSGQIWRIISPKEDGPTKVIAASTISLADDIQVGYTNEGDVKIYNPTEKGNVGYYINQKTADAVDEKYFVTEEIEVPIYKKFSTYTGKKTTKKYKVKFHAPNMYDMFAAYEANVKNGYWLMNSSEEAYQKYVISSNGTIFYKPIYNSYTTYIRPVGYLDKNCKIVSGSGTLSDPYKIKK